MDRAGTWTATWQPSGACSVLLDQKAARNEHQNEKGKRAVLSAELIGQVMFVLNWRDPRCGKNRKKAQRNVVMGTGD